MFFFVITKNFEFNSVITIAMRKTRTKLRKSFKGILNVVNFKLFSKVKGNSLIISYSKIAYLLT